MVFYTFNADQVWMCLAKQYVVPKTTTWLMVDIHANLTIQLLCAVAELDLVIVSWGSKLALPIVL
jgi:hypothetical protein